MARKIFVSYRRDDASADARSICQRLESKFGRRRVFIDVDAINPGRDFREVLDTYLKNCRIMVVVIGPRWLDIPDDSGSRRIDDPNDYVHIEIANALSRNLAIIPLLVNGARMPSADDLPDALQPLVFRQAIIVRHDSFPRDMSNVETEVRRILHKRRPLIWTGVLLFFLSLGALALYFSSPPKSPPRQAMKPVPKSSAKQTPKKATQSGPSIRESAALKPVIVNALTAEQERALKPRDTFKECDICPEMVMAPKGSFMMGSTSSDPNHFSMESPQHLVTIARPFAVGKFAVTRSEFMAFTRETKHETGNKCWVYEHPSWSFLTGLSLHSPGFPQDDDHPVVCVNWGDAKSYVEWLSKKTGKKYRLLTEAEREYVARAGTTTPYWWGRSISVRQANYNGKYSEGGAAIEYRRKTVPVASFEPNPWGLFQVHGNVLEWVEDCNNTNYMGAPENGSAWVSGNCSERVLRGGSWASISSILRSAYRYANPAQGRATVFGFRVARTLER